MAIDQSCTNEGLTKRRVEDAGRRNWGFTVAMPWVQTDVALLGCNDARADHQNFERGGGMPVMAHAGERVVRLILTHAGVSFGGETGTR